MERGIEIIFVVSLTLTGLSHLFQPAAWVELFIGFRQKGAAGVMLVGLMHLPFALLVVAWHPVWTGIPAIVTILGWAWLLKATLYLLIPRIGLKSLAAVSHERMSWFQVAGAVLVFISGLVGWSVWSTRM